MRDTPTVTSDEASDQAPPIDPQTRSFIRQSPSAIAVTDAHDRIVEWNPEAAALFGFARDDVLGEELGPLILGDHTDAHRQAVAAHLRNGDPTVLERNVTVSCRHRDGTRVWALVTSGSLTSTTGDPLFVVWLRHMHRHDEERRRDPGLDSTLEALINNISDVITVLGPHGEWVSSSGAGTRILGWEPNLDPEGGIYALRPSR